MTIRQQLHYLEGQLGTPAGSCIALQELNNARLNLWRKGDWSDTYEFIHIMVSSGRLTLPWWAASMKAAWLCKSKIQISETGWQPATGTDAKGSGLSIENTGRKLIIPFNIPVGAQIGFSATDIADKGKKVRVSAITDASGRLSEEAELAGIAEKVRCEITIAQLTGLSKDATSGCVNVHMYDSCGDRVIYTIDPDETVSESIVYCVKSCGDKCILAKVKKKFIPYSNLNLDAIADLPVTALQYMIEALRNRSDANMYKSLYGMAIAELQADKIDERPTVAATRAGFHVDILN